MKSHRVVGDRNNERDVIKKRVVKVKEVDLSKEDNTKTDDEDEERSKRGVLVDDTHQTETFWKCRLDGDKN